MIARPARFSNPILFCSIRVNKVTHDFQQARFPNCGQCDQTVVSTSQSATTASASVIIVRKVRGSEIQGRLILII